MSPGEAVAAHVSCRFIQLARPRHACDTDRCMQPQRARRRAGAWGLLAAAGSRAVLSRSGPRARCRCCRASGSAGLLVCLSGAVKHGQGAARYTAAQRPQLRCAQQHCCYNGMHGWALRSPVGGARLPRARARPAMLAGSISGAAPAAASAPAAPAAPAAQQASAASTPRAKRAVRAMPGSGPDGPGLARVGESPVSADLERGLERVLMDGRTDRTNYDKWTGVQAHRGSSGAAGGRGRHTTSA